MPLKDAVYSFTIQWDALTFLCGFLLYTCYVFHVYMLSNLEFPIYRLTLDVLTRCNTSISMTSFIIFFKKGKHFHYRKKKGHHRLSFLSPFLVLHPSSNGKHLWNRFSRVSSSPQL